MTDELDDTESEKRENASTSQNTRRSAVWQAFDKLTKQRMVDGILKNYKIAKCKYCPKEIEIERSNTTNPTSHLETTHYSVWMKLFPNKVPRKSKSASASGTPDIRHALVKGLPYETDSREFRERTNAVLNYITSDGRPLSTVDSIPFRSMLAAFDSRYKLPSRRTISDTYLSKSYSDTRSCIQQLITSAISSGQGVPMLSFTTDLWTSSIQEPYISLTVHYVDAAFVMKAHTLETQYIPDRHTGVNLALTMKDLMESWGIGANDMRVITTDSAANMVKMGREGGFDRLPCFGHLLHNAVCNALNDDRKRPQVKKCTQKLKEVIAYFHQSHHRQLKLKEELELENKPSVRLVADCSTRWGSTYNMYESIRKNLNAIKKALVVGDSGKVPNKDDEVLINGVCEALQPFAVMTDSLSGESQPTASSVLPMVQIISTLRYEKHLTPFSRELRNDIYDYFQNK